MHNPEQTAQRFHGKPLIDSGLRPTLFLLKGAKEKTLVNPKMWQAISFYIKEVDMAQERLTMRKIREIIRLKYEAGLSDRAIAGACKVSNSTVGEYLRRAKAGGLSWPLPEMGEEELYRRLFPERRQAVREKSRPMPDWDIQSAMFASRAFCMPSPVLDRMVPISPCFVL